MATATTMNILPFGRLTKDVLTAYQSRSMAVDILARIPLHRVDNFYTKAKKQRMWLASLEEGKACLGNHDELSDQVDLQRLR